METKNNTINSLEKGKIYYLCLQEVREGQASYAHANEIISGLRDQQWQVSLFSVLYSNSDYSPSILTRIIEFFKIQVRLFQTHPKPNVLYIRNHFATLPAALWAKLNNITTIQEINSTYEDIFNSWPNTRKLSWLIQWLIRKQMYWADAIITVTPTLKEWIYKEVGSKNIFVIPNGANTRLFNPEAKSPSQYSSVEPYVIFFGAMSPWQGIDLLLDAVNSSQWPNQVKLLFIGDGIESHKIQTQAVSNQKIKYLGKKPYKEIPSWVAGSLAAISPKTSLGAHGMYCSPLKLYEALACGVPVIVTDFPGQAELIKNQKCGLVVPEDSQALAEAVAYLYKNEETRKEMGNRGYKVVRDYHSWFQRAVETEKVILSTLNKNESKK